MARAFFLFIGCCLILGSCTQRSICPAFQSAYIHDKDALRKKFSYFLEDSTPKMLTASKNKYLIAEPTSYRKKVRSLQTVAMKPVPVHVPDSILYGDSVSMEELDRAARSVIDSTYIEDVPAQQLPPVEDSVYVISKDRELRLLKYNGADSLVYDPVSEKYVAQKPEYYVKDVGLNIEQDNYMWYLRDHLVLPDVRLAKIQQGNAKEKSAKEQRAKKKKEKKGLKGFFKNLFKKKPKASDSTDVPAPPKEEFDFIDADTLTQTPPPTTDPEEKKGFFSPRKKKSKEKDTADPALNPITEKKKKNSKTQEAAVEPKKEEVVDGF
ncbi:MAG: hypothetical protein WD824_22490 [Cyclobacteriaceae bacterium]